MKPFDLEKALAGEPAVTKDGRLITNIVHYNTKDGEWLVGLIEDRLHLFPKINDRFTLVGIPIFMAEKPKVKREGWVMLPKGLTIYQSIKDVVPIKSPFPGGEFIAKIEWEEEV